MQASTTSTPVFRENSILAEFPYRLSQLAPALLFGCTWLLDIPPDTPGISVWSSRCLPRRPNAVFTRSYVQERRRASATPQLVDKGARERPGEACLECRPTASQGQRPRPRSPRTRRRSTGSDSPLGTRGREPPRRTPTGTQASIGTNRYTARSWQTGAAAATKLPGCAHSRLRFLFFLAHRMPGRPRLSRSTSDERVREVVSVIRNGRKSKRRQEREGRTK